MTKLASIVLAMATIAFVATAHAQTGQRPQQQPQQAPSAAPNAPVQPGGRTVSEAELRKELERLGFTNVRDIKQKGSNIEAKATKDGKRVSLNIDTNTGRVTAR
jgi:predicted RNA binding protein YcfA (HicA-like mRNA interferase family)